MLALAEVGPLSRQAFAELGRAEIAYVKRVEANGVVAYAIHAADGTQLWAFADCAVAFAALRQHDLAPQSVH